MRSVSAAIYPGPTDPRTDPRASGEKPGAGRGGARALARPGAKCAYLLEDTCAGLAKNMAFGRGDGFPAIVLTNRRDDIRPGCAGTARKGRPTRRAVPQRDRVAEQVPSQVGGPGHLVAGQVEYAEKTPPRRARPATNGHVDQRDALIDTK
jgi:hypothetical protein